MIGVIRGNLKWANKLYYSTIPVFFALIKLVDL